VKPPRKSLTVLQSKPQGKSMHHTAQQDALLWFLLQEKMAVWEAPWITPFNPWFGFGEEGSAAMRMCSSGGRKTRKREELAKFSGGKLYKGGRYLREGPCDLRSQGWGVYIESISWI